MKKNEDASNIRDHGRYQVAKLGGESHVLAANSNASSATNVSIVTKETRVITVRVTTRPASVSGSTK